MPTILLIQFRSDAKVRAHEIDCFAQKAGLPLECFIAKNALDTAITKADWEHVDAVVLAGSGDYLVSQGDIPEVMANMKSLLFDLREAKKPTLGVCFGAQIMDKSFGGSVELDAARQETGVFEIHTFEAAQQDPIFSAFPKSFHVMLGHKDHLTTLGEGLIGLGGNKTSPFHMFSIPGVPMYGFLFHPELDLESMLYRLSYYRENYAISDEEIEEMRRTNQGDISWGVVAYRAFLERIAGIAQQ